MTKNLNQRVGDVSVSRNGQLEKAELHTSCVQIKNKNIFVVVVLFLLPSRAAAVNGGA